MVMKLITWPFANVLELCIDNTTYHDGSGTVSFMENNTVMIPSGNLILNYPEPFSFKTLNYPPNYL